MAELKITQDNFQAEVLESDIPVLVDFWATWCGPCKMVGPIVAEIAEEYEGKVKVGKVNVDEQSSLAQKFSIMSIPTIAVIKNGQTVDIKVGVRPKQEILSMVK